MNYINIITKNYDRILLGTIMILLVLGVVMLYSASSIRSIVESGGRTDTLYLTAHLKRILISVIVMFVFMIVDYRKLKPFAIWFLLGSIVLLIATKIVYFAKGMNSASRWLYLGPFSIQTSDIARLSLIIYLAAYIDQKRDQIKDFYHGFLPPIVIIAVLMGVIVFQPDYSTAAMIGLIGAIMLFTGGAKLSQLLATGTVGIAVGIPILFMEPYRRARIMDWISGNQETATIGYQTHQSLISLSNGGFFGLGLGNSMEKNLFLPEPHTDFIFAIIGEELGFIGGIFLLTLFLVIFQRGIKIAKQSTDPFGIMLAIGISFSFILYAFVNAAVVTNVFPVTGLPMPLISFGGSSMLINLAGIGILLNISQSKRSVTAKRGWRSILHG